MINYNVDSDGIATITWDMPNRTMNVLNEASITAYAGALEKALKDDKVKGIIVTSGKADFIAGADLEMLLGADTSDAAKLMDQFSQLQKLFRRQETGGKPVVAAINGTALGGGFEICLASHYRIAAANPRAKVGQPEVKIGLLPGAGGTQRIPRLIGVMNAAPILIEGKDLTVDAAKGLGLIHEVVPAGELLAKAKAWLMAPAAEQVVPEYAGKGAKAIDGRAVQPWDRKGFKTPGFPGGQVWSPPGVQTFIGGNAMIAGKTNGVYPAPKAIMTCVYEGLQLPFDSALRVETRYFVSLLRNPVAKSMIRTLFFGLQEANKLARRPKGVPKQEYKKIGILGAGLMGAGIATVAAQAGLDIVLVDRDQAVGRQGQGAYRGRARQARQARPARPGRSATRLLASVTRDAGLRRAEGLPARGRGGVREPRGQGRGDQEGRGGAARGGRVRVQHLDAADHRPGRGVGAAGPVHRPALLLAGREDAAGRDHRRQEDLARDARRAPWTSCRRSARRRSWSTTAAASSPPASAAPSSAKAIACSRRACPPP